MCVCRVHNRDRRSVALLRQFERSDDAARRIAERKGRRPRLLNEGSPMQDSARSIVQIDPPEFAEENQPRWMATAVVPELWHADGF